MSMLHGFIDHLLRASWQAGIAAIAVAAVSFLAGRRLSPGMRHALWFIVVARLLMPVAIPSPLSLFNFAPALQATPAPRTFPDRVIHIQSANLPASAAPSTRTFDWRLLALIFWAAGAIFVTFRLLRANLRFASQLRRAKRVVDPQFLALLAACQREMNISRRLTCLETSAIATPAVFGPFKPKLLLPAQLALSQQELRFILLHELAHLKRHDLLIDCGLAILQIIHWFNPLLWLAFARCRADRELARDAMVLRLLQPGQRQSYGQTLLKLVEDLVPNPSHPGLLAMLEERGQLRRRIQSIASHRRTLIGGTILAILLLIVLAVVTLTDRKSITKKPTSQPATLPTLAPAKLEFGAWAEPASSLARDRTQLLLDRRLPEIRFDEVALSDVIDFFRDVTGANISVDWKVLEAAGVQRTAPVTARLRNIRFAKALSSILTDVNGNAANLVFTVKDDGGILITTAAELKRNTEVLPQVQIEVRILSIPDGFAAVGLPATQPAANETPTCISDDQVNALIRATQASSKATTLTAPRLTVFNGQRGQIIIDGSGGDVGVELSIQPTASDDRKSVNMIIHASIAGPPKTSLDDITSVPDGQTLVIRKFRGIDAAPNPQLLLLIRPRLTLPSDEYQHFPLLNRKEGQ